MNVDWDALQQFLIEKGFCGSPIEAAAIVENVKEELAHFPLEADLLKTTLSENIGDDISIEDFLEMEKLGTVSRRVEEMKTDVFSDDPPNGIVGGNDSDDDDKNFLGEGCCELCERSIKLSRHHLIPKSTWPRIETKLLRAGEAIEKGDLHRAGMIAEGLEHLLPCISAGENAKRSIRVAMQRTANVCRPCHSAVHAAADNISLAVHYNTVEKLLSNDKVFRFSKWASKQRAGKYSTSVL